jgi:Uma2 family endonuclease
MTSAEAIQELLASPELPNAVAQLSTILESEKQRRERFYDEITPSMKAEFINGEVIVHSPVTLSHLQASRNIMRMLDGYVAGQALGQVFPEKALIALTRNDYEPDISYFAKEKADKFSATQATFPPPDLIVEVLSPSTERRDRGIKFKDYAAHGVQEYWIVNPDARELELYRLEGGAYQLALKSGSGDVESFVVPGFTIPIKAIFDSELALQTLKQILQSWPKQKPTG